MAMLVVDQGFRVDKVNALAARLAGRQLSEIQDGPPGAAAGCLLALADPNGCGVDRDCGGCVLRQAILTTLRTNVSVDSVDGWVPVEVRGGHPQRYLRIATVPLEVQCRRKALVCALDVTDQKTAEAATLESVAALEVALREKTALLHEVHHRVKNNLAVISSLLGMQADTSAAPDCKRALEQSRLRVRAMAMVHENLYGGQHLDRVNFAEYTEHLIEELGSALAREQGQIAIDLDIEPIEIDIRLAMPCALILNELVSNAFKHAFPNGRTGKIVVQFGKAAPGRLRLVIEDDGIGWSADETTKTTSHGLEIVRILAGQVAGTLEQEPAKGTRFVLDVPSLSAHAAGARGYALVRRFVRPTRPLLG